MANFGIPVAFAEAAQLGELLACAKGAPAKVSLGLLSRVEVFQLTTPAHGEIANSLSSP